MKAWSYNFYSRTTIDENGVLIPKNETLDMSGYKYHHTAYTYGYIPAHFKAIHRYSGRFGTGFVVATTYSHISTTYCFLDYYILK